MEAPLAGITVVEVANWLAAPSTAALLCDLGARVIKVEPPGGDAWRAYDLATQGHAYDFPTNYAFELDNRGKQSITIDLGRPTAPELVHRLVRTADIFLTNLVPERRQRFRLTADLLQAVNPALIDVSITGYGAEGPDASRPGFDYAAYWARSGIMDLISPPDPQPPTVCRAGQGDHATALNALAATLAALRLRDRTGQGQVVEISLQRTGLWTIGTDLAGAAVSGRQPARLDRDAPRNPIWNTYRAADGRWLLLVMPQPDPYWPAFCDAIAEPAWVDDPRYATLAARAEHGRELAAAIADRFARHDLAHWARQLDAFGVIWAPAAALPEVLDDPQLRATGAFALVDHPRVGPYTTLNAPFRIRGADVAVRGPAPEPGADTADVLAGLGCTDAEIAALAAAGVFG